MRVMLTRKRHCCAAGASILLIAAPLIGLMVGCPPAPIELRDWHALHAIRDNLGGSYVLMNDLDSTTAGYTELAGLGANQGRGWEPIGTSDAPFSGSFDGQEYQIRDLFINRPDQDYVGLFGDVSWVRHIDNVGVIQNARVVNADVTGGSCVGALVGHNGGIVSNTYSTGSVTGDERVGGLVGWNQHTVRNSYSVASVTGNREIGGLVGETWYQGGVVSNSYSRGSVTGSSRVGGLAGWNRGVLKNSYSTASVTGDERVGGLVGYNTGTVSNSFWDRTTSGTEESDGGTGTSTEEMRDIRTFTNTAAAGLDEPWNMSAVAAGETDATSIWNVVDGQAYPFLSWQSVG